MKVRKIEFLDSIPSNMNFITKNEDKFYLKSSVYSFRVDDINFKELQSRYGDVEKFLLRANAKPTNSSDNFFIFELKPCFDREEINGYSFIERSSYDNNIIWNIRWFEDGLPEIFYRNYLLPWIEKVPRLINEYEDLLSKINKEKAISWNLDEVKSFIENQVNF